MPSMVVDLVNSSGLGQLLDSITVGGAPLPDTLPARVTRVFPSATLFVAFLHNTIVTHYVGIEVRAMDQRRQTAWLLALVSKLCSSQDY